MKNKPVLFSPFLLAHVYIFIKNSTLHFVLFDVYSKPELSEIRLIYAKLGKHVALGRAELVIQPF